MITYLVWTLLVYNTHAGVDFYQLGGDMGDLASCVRMQESTAVINSSSKAYVASRCVQVSRVAVQPQHNVTVLPAPPTSITIKNYVRPKS